MRPRIAERLRAPVAALSNPEYVGENRCWPCTATNVGLLSLGAAAVWFVSPAVAASVALAGVAVIALRGYLVPYTPRFAPVLLDRFPVDVTKRPTERSDAGGVAPADGDGEAVLERLLDAGVVRGETELALDESFHADWRAAMERLRDADLESELDATVPRITAEAYEWRDDEWYAVRSVDPDVTTKSLSRPVALADVAAVQTLTDRGVSRATACNAAAPLRQFLSACPRCDAELVVGDEGCCGGFGPSGPSQVLACEACDASVFVFPE